MVFSIENDVFILDRRPTGLRPQNEEGNEMNTDPKETDMDDPKTVTIIVNTREKTVEKNNEISFEEIVSLAYDGSPPTGKYIEFTVMYRRGHGNKDGSLVVGKTVKVKEGMVFNVSATDRS
jgi:hypothetical protein